MRWRKVQFKEIVEFPPKVKLEAGEEYDFIPMDQVDGGVKYVQDINRKAYTGGGAKFSNGDTIFARITPCLENGKIAKVKNLEKGIGFGSTEFFVFRAIEGASDPDFIYYLAKSETIRQPAIKSMVGASGRQRADKGVVEEIEIDIPPLPTQRRIAAILSAYDDLIDNNLKRIRLLEEAAQHIYREWFVHFRFPGHERVRRGADGLPEGWRRVNLYEFADVQMGYPFNSQLFNDGGHGTPAIRIRDIPNQWTSTFTTEDADEKYIVERGDILIGMDGFFYTDYWAGQRGYLVQRVCRIRAKNTDLQGYLLEALKPSIKYFEQTISGATVAHLGAKHLSQIEILLPNWREASELSIFNKLHKQRVALYASNALLKEARDILLPRLMNRTIEV